MDISTTAALADALRIDTTTLKSKHRKGGSEYRFKEGAGRPTLVLTAAAGDQIEEPTRTTGRDNDVALLTDAQTSASLVTNGSQDASVLPGVAPLMTAAATGAPSGASGGVLLEEYDAKFTAARDKDTLRENVARLRGEASTTRHATSKQEMRLSTLQCELRKLSSEDEIAHERSAGLRAVGDERIRIALLSSELLSAEQVARTLAYMLQRCHSSKVTQLGALRAFEDAIRVQGRELALTSAHLTAVHKSRDTELLELARMRSAVKKQLSVLDAKLEGRRLEVKSRQEKARWRVANAKEERALRAHGAGELSEAEERAMIERAKNLSTETAELRATKLTMQGDADAAEALFHKLRFAAGAPGAPPDATSAHRPDDSTLDVVGGSVFSPPTQVPLVGSIVSAATAGEECEFIAPDTAPIIARFALLEDEVRGIDEAMRDYGARVSMLHAERDALSARSRGMTTPGATLDANAAAVETNLVGLLDALAGRTYAANRVLDVKRGEADAVHALKLAVEQSLRLLGERLEAMPAPHVAYSRGERSVAGEDIDGGDGEVLAAPRKANIDAAQHASTAQFATDQQSVRAMLSRDFDAAPTAWAARMHATLGSFIMRLHGLLHVLDPALAERHYGHGMRWLAAADNRFTSAALRPVCSPLAEAVSGSREMRNTGAISIAASLEPQQALSAQRLLAVPINDDDRALEVTIEGIITRHECNVRVRPSLQSTATTMTRHVTGKVLSEAAHAFDMSWKAGGVQLPTTESRNIQLEATLRGTNTIATTNASGQPDLFSREASHNRRRQSRIDIQAHIAPDGDNGADGCNIDVDHGPELMSAGQAPSESLFTAVNAVNRTRYSRSGSEDERGVSGSRPQVRDVQRFLAAALASSGDEVDGPTSSRTHKDMDDVTTRERLKRATRTQLHQAHLETTAGTIATNGHRGAICAPPPCD